MKKLYFPLVAVATLFGVNSVCAQEAELTEVWTKIYHFDADKWSGAAPDWSNPEKIKDGSCTRIGTGLNGKIYSLNMRTMSIMEFDAEGNRDVYKLPSLEGRTLNYYNPDADLTPASCPDYYGTLITHDDAGNFIVGHGFTTGAMPKTWTVYSPSKNQAKTFDVEFPDAPKGSILRIDAIGRALGDVTKEGVLWVAPTSIFWGNIKGFQDTWAKNTIQVAKAIYFYGDGELDDNLTASGSVSNMVYLSSALSSVCQPLYNSMEELLDTFDQEGEQAYHHFILYSKNGGEAYVDNQYALTLGFNNGLQSTNPIADFATTDMGTNYAQYGGFDSFVLNGERYYVTNYSTKDENAAVHGSMKIAVFDKNGMIIKTWDNPEYASTYGYCTISTEKIDETSANIYVYCATTKLTSTEDQAAAAAQLVFKAADSAGINDIIVSDDSNVAPVYYNLQGVEIANPENGIYVVRRGNKISKEYIK